MNCNPANSILLGMDHILRPLICALISTKEQMHLESVPAPLHWIKIAQ